MALPIRTRIAGTSNCKGMPGFSRRNSPVMLKKMSPCFPPEICQRPDTLMSGRVIADSTIFGA